ncbi:hypothetical protein GCM10009808_03960 [Microbacterium sediminicola]|uniref:Lipoyl-binding domain-containing protein n=1 Tax=Microbacterium sediminicola TaxID=415210 RepID=A0ABP4TLF2_9MICO
MTDAPGFTSSADRLDEATSTTRPRLWVALAALALVVVGALGWALFGAVPLVAEGTAVAYSSQGQQSVLAGADGVVRLSVTFGDEVSQGDEVAEITSADGSRVTAAVATGAGTIHAVLVADGSAVESQTPLFIIVSDASTSTLLFYASQVEAARIHSGDDVVVAIAGSADLSATVSAVSEIPAPAAEMDAVFGLAAFAEQQLADDGGAAYRVQIDLEESETATAGELANVQIRYATVSPWQILWGSADVG